ncbi:MAG TPA: hypothetical protein VFS39_02265 [Nitrospira sp.]|nr:hypothetical protein [Nitrospira sp.]
MLPILKYHSTRHQPQNHIHVEPLMSEEIKMRLLERAENALRELLAGDRNDRHRRVFRHFGAIGEIDERVLRQRSPRNPAGHSHARSEIEGRRDTGDHRKVQGTMVTRPSNIQQEQLRFNLTHRPVIRQHRSMHGNGRKASADQQEGTG